MIAAFVLALAASLSGAVINSALQESQGQAQATQSNPKLSKKDRKRLEKEEKQAREQQRKEEKHVQEKQTKEQRKKYKEEEKEVAKQRKRELKEEEKQVASAQKKDGKYERKEAQREQKAEVRDMDKHIAREEKASIAAVPRHAYVSRIPISTTAPPRLLLAQRDVSRAIYSQLPRSNVRVLLNGGNQIVLSGPAPSPSWRQRLLQLAVGAAQGYSVVDQLAANLVGDAAGAATSAAMGGVSDLIHGSGGKNSGPESASAPPPGSVAQTPPDSQQALPNRDAEVGAGVLDSGSNACVNVSSSRQVMLTGQLASATSADLIRRFAHQVAGPSAVVNDQLAVRTSGVPSAGNAPQDVPGTSGSAETMNANSQTTAVSPGSTVCVTENSGQTFLTGTVGSTAELGAVENAVQPLVGNGRLLDQLTIAGITSAGQMAPSASAADHATPPAQQNELEQALHSLPQLANVNVQVGSDGVHLSGSVDSTQDDQTASDIVRQYAPGRPVLDNMAVQNRMQPFPH